MTGSGTLTDPFIIYDVNDLQNMQLVPLAYYELGNDIDASATIGWDGGRGFKPITQEGYDNPSGDFYDFDGKGHKITSLYERRDDSDTGLFSNLLWTNIKNLELKDVDFAGAPGWYNTGGIAALIEGNCSISGCKVSGTIRGADNSGFVGGIVGSTSYPASAITISDCEVDVVIGGIAEGAGGIAGGARNIKFTNCTTTGTIQKDAGPDVFFMGEYEGGIAGQVYDCNFEGCRSSMTVLDSQISTGGLVGDIYNSGADTYSMHDCHATGKVGGAEYIGGLIGCSNADDTPEATLVDKCTTACDMTEIAEATKAGGLIGLNQCSTITNSSSSSNIKGTLGIAGGLVGEHDGGDITNCYATGDVESDEDAYPSLGGFIGFVYAVIYMEITKCYATGNVTSTNQGSGIGGFIGNVLQSR
jgi:hypothetical protein